MIKYSMIIPVYNAEKFLKQCVGSILQQKRADFELILVDDCSKDNSLSICKHFESEDARVKVLRQESNQGVSASRNLGIETAKGEFLLFVDADDFVSEDYLEQIDSETSKGFDLLSFGNFEYIINSDGQAQTAGSSMNIDLKAEHPTANEWETFIVKSFFASPWNKVYRTDLIQKNHIRFDTRCVCFEDYIFNANYCCFAQSFLSVSSPLYYYRTFKNINHVSKRKWGERFHVSRNVVAATEKLLESLGKNTVLKNIRRYSFQAYVTELKAAELVSSSELENALDILVTEKSFFEAAGSIVPQGKALSVLHIANALRLHRLTKKIIQKYILGN